MKATGLKETTVAAGWDRFFTNEDRQLIADTGWAKQAPFGFGTRPALVIVDAYYGSLGLPRRPILEAIAEWPAACGTRGWDAIDATASVLASARNASLPIYFLTGLPANPNPWNRKKSARRATTEPPFLQIVDELSPMPGEIVLEKTSPSGFATTGLDGLLRQQRCDTVILCGEATSGCVRATAVDGCVAGYAIGVVSDCCFDRVEASHWMNLFDMHQKYGDVVDSEAARRYFESLPEMTK